jgi:hypothetical protein
MLGEVLYDLAALLERALGGPHFFLAFCVWLPIQTCLTVAVHEAGHALAALARRQPGVEIRMGTGQSVVLEARLQGVKLRLANPGFLRVGSGQVRWDAERTTVLDLLVIAVAGPVASLLGGLVCFSLAGQCTWGSELYDFLGLSGFYMIAFGCVLNLLPFTLSEGTRRHPGVAMRTDGGIILDLLRLIASLRTDSGT